MKDTSQRLPVVFPSIGNQVSLRHLQPKTLLERERDRFFGNKIIPSVFVPLVSRRGKCFWTFCLLSAVSLAFRRQTVIIGTAVFPLTAKKGRKRKEANSSKQSEKPRAKNVSGSLKGPYFLSGYNKSTSKFSFEDHKINKNAYRRRSKEGCFIAP